MSKRFIGNIITSTPTEPIGSGSTDVASGIWSVNEIYVYRLTWFWPTA